jgi:hypothetical protein
VRDAAGEVAESEQRDAELDRAQQESEQERRIEPRLGLGDLDRAQNAIEIALVGPLIS